MGALLSSLWLRVWGNKEARILILGLDGAGKTTILYQLRMGEVVSTIPTIGFNVETVKFNKLQLQVWDLGGQTSIRPYWRCYYANTDALVYVVDSCDKDRIELAKHELMAMLNEEELKKVPLLVLANKQDLTEALKAKEISELLGLSNIKDRDYSIQATSAIAGEGLREGLDWLETKIRTK